MSTTRARSVLSVALIAGAATLASTGPAQAAVYSGNWDPAYGSIFPSLGWKASALLNVPDACLAIGNGNNIPISGSCAGFSVLSAEVDLYDIASPSTVLQSFGLQTNVIVNGIDIADGRLAGIDTGFFHYFVPSLEIAGSGDYSFSLLLYGGNLAQLTYEDPPTTSPGCAFLTVEGARCGLSANVAHGVFAPVPEPESYALLLAGLGALGVAARRRRS